MGGAAWPEGLEVCLAPRLASSMSNTFQKSSGFASRPRIRSFESNDH